MAIMLKIIIAILLSLMSGQTGHNQQNAEKPEKVCHSQTEDSPPYDCNYVHGAWITR